MSTSRDPVTVKPEVREDDLNDWARGADDAAADRTIAISRELAARGLDPLSFVERRLELAAHRPLAAMALAVVVGEAPPSERARHLAETLAGYWSDDASLAYLLGFARSAR